MGSGRSIINVWDRVGNRNKPGQQTGSEIQRLMRAEHLTDPSCFFSITISRYMHVIKKKKNMKTSLIWIFKYADVKKRAVRYPISDYAFLCHSSAMRDIPLFVNTDAWVCIFCDTRYGHVARKIDPKSGVIITLQWNWSRFLRIHCSCSLPAVRIHIQN